MDNFEIMAMPWLDFAEDCLRLRQGLAYVDSYVCRLGNFSIEVRMQTSPVGTHEDCIPLNVNAKVFTQNIGKGRLENSTGKGKARRLLITSESY